MLAESVFGNRLTRLSLCENRKQCAVELTRNAGFNYINGSRTLFEDRLTNGGVLLQPAQTYPPGSQCHVQFTTLNGENLAVNVTSEGTEQGAGRAAGAGAQVLAFVEVFLLSLWLGSMIFFSFAVAPSAFAVLPTRELAGVMVTSTIAKVEVLGLAIGLLLLFIQAAAWHKHSSTTIKTLKVVLVVIMIAAAAMSHFWISPSLVSLRAAMGGHIDDLPPTDPMRVEFNDLHQYSVALMTIAMTVGLALLFITVRSCLKR